MSYNSQEFDTAWEMLGPKFEMSSHIKSSVDEPTVRTLTWSADSYEITYYLLYIKRDTSIGASY